MTKTYGVWLVEDTDFKPVEPGWCGDGVLNIEHGQRYETTSLAAAHEHADRLARYNPSCRYDVMSVDADGVWTPAAEVVLASATCRAAGTSQEGALCRPIIGDTGTPNADAYPTRKTEWRRLLERDTTLMLAGDSMLEYIPTAIDAGLLARALFATDPRVDAIVSRHSERPEDSQRIRKTAWDRNDACIRTECEARAQAMLACIEFAPLIVRQTEGT